MAGKKRSRARILGAERAASAALGLGKSVATARRRRQRSQESLADEVGISRSRLAELELGQNASTPAQVWFALGEALGIYLTFEFGRDPQVELRDAGHADIEELVLRLTKPMNADAWTRTVSVAREGEIITADPPEGAYRTDLAAAAREGLEGDVNGNDYQKETIEVTAGGN